MIDDVNDSDGEGYPSHIHNPLNADLELVSSAQVNPPQPLQQQVEAEETASEKVVNNASAYVVRGCPGHR
jgi:hypothetical protein